MATNPYEEASRTKPVGRGRIWAVVVAVAALVTTVAWAAPQASVRLSAELTAGGTGHMVAATNETAINETIRFEESQPDEEYELSAVLHLVDDDGNDRGALTANGRAVETKELVRPGEDGRTLSVPLAFDARGLEGKTSCALKQGLPDQGKAR